MARRPTTDTLATSDTRAEAEARIALSEWRAIFENMQEGFFVGEVRRDDQGNVDDFVFLTMNAAFEEQTGINAAEAVGRNAREVVKNLRPDTIAIYARVVNTGEPIDFERTFPERDGRRFEARARKVGPDRFSLLFLDISKRKSEEELARASATKFRSFAQTVPAHVWTSSPDGMLDWFNDRAYQYTGLSEGEGDGTGWTQIVHPDDLERAAVGWGAALVSQQTYEVEFRLRRADGVYRWHLGRAVPIRDDAGRVSRWIGTNTDIEDQKTMSAALADLNATLEQRVQDATRDLLEREAQLSQAQKMDALGKLTSGIAHDFNNMLAVVISSMTLARRRIGDGKTDIGALLDAGLDGANRAAGLTARLLAIAREQPLSPSPLDANDLINGMTDLLRRTLGAGVRVEAKLSKGIWRVHADRSQLENAILNLAVNARDAMSNGGLLTLETGNTILDAVDVARHGDVPPGDYVRIIVRDSGAGMTPDVLKRAFDPFFTTKPTGVGTGLGLSQVFGFVKQSNGHVDIQSRPDDGTSVNMLLPRYKDDEADAA